MLPTPLQSCDFVCYSDSEDEEDTEKSIDISCSFVQCNLNRQLGLNRKFQRMEMSSEYATRHMLSNSMMKEYEVTVGNMNKVFSSQWLSHKQVIFGTKCNKLMVLDVTTKKIDHIPSLESREAARPPNGERGVNSIEINPSKTLLTTGASNSNDVAVYRLPTLDPVCVGGRGHQDWIFDQTWIDDQFFVSGSRDAITVFNAKDGSISLWRITDQLLEEASASDLPKHRYMEPLLTKACKQADKVRALCYNHRTQEIAVISPNSYIHCWNALTMKQLMSKKLPHTLENCCLSADEDCQMYAVGSKSHTDLLDSRSLQSVRKIPSRNAGCGIRSVSFKGNILTIGTGTGLIMFWDLRASKFLESTINSNRVAQLKAGRGWVKRDDLFLGRDPESKYMPAIYTHSYDSSGTRLFAAGGPLQNSQMGSNYDTPTIQLKNDLNGVLILPHGSQGGKKSFSFSIQAQQDASSYQCLKTTPQGLETLGQMRETIRVQANEDVYERTIQKQQEVKRENEKKTTKLLENKDKKKLNLPRCNQVVKTNTVKSIPPPTSRHYPSATSAFSSTESSYSGPGRGGPPGGFGGGGGGSRPPPHHHSSSTITPSSHHQEKHSVNKKYEINAKCHSSNKPTPNPEILKRPLRERLIHLLAVKPYRKVELLPRLQRDGLREKDKKQVMPCLSEVANYKSNIYELKRSVWNDVMEDWPFYTESDKAALRRRKPQNLTPPGSDNGSTSSGHSPSSTNPPSPPQITNPLKRQSYYEPSSDTAKKKRVSHYKRPPSSAAGGGSDHQMSGFARSPYSLSGSSPMMGGSGQHGGGGSTHGGTHSNNVSPSPSLDSTHSSGGRSTNMDRLDHLPNGSGTSIFEDASAPDWGQFPNDNDQPPAEHVNHHHNAAVAAATATAAASSHGRSNSPFNNYQHSRSSPASGGGSTTSSSQQLINSFEANCAVENSHHGSGSGSGRAAAASPHAGSWNSDRIDGSPTDNSGASPPLNLQFNYNNTNTDYLTEYVPILTRDQRVRYKKEYNTHYNEYLRYHEILRQAKSRFTKLSKQRENLQRGTPEYRRFSETVMAEYSRYSQDPVYQEANMNFHYLHNKLAHIRQLIHEFDTMHRS